MVTDHHRRADYCEDVAYASFPVCVAVTDTVIGTSDMGSVVIVAAVAIDVDLSAVWADHFVNGVVVIVVDGLQYVVVVVVIDVVVLVVDLTVVVVEKHLGLVAMVVAAVENTSVAVVPIQYPKRN